MVARAGAATTYHSNSTTPQNPGEVYKLSNDSADVRESDGPIKFTILSWCWKVIRMGRSAKLILDGSGRNSLVPAPPFKRPRKCGPSTMGLY